MADSREQRLDAYRASIASLTKKNASLRLEQKRMKWVAITTVLAALISYRFIDHTVGVFVLLVGGAAFVVGHYVVYMHLQENKLTIKSAKQTIASLDGDHIGNVSSRTTT